MPYWLIVKETGRASMAQCFRWCIQVVAPLFFCPFFLITPGLPAAEIQPSGPLATLRSTNSSYVLLPNDLIRVEVYKEEDLRTETRVDQDGTVFLPLVKLVSVGGRTISEAREIVRKFYEADYLVTADVTITLVESSQTNRVEVKRKLTITISGEVKKPGVVELPEGEKVDLVKAIAMAGDFTPLANKRSVTVKRTEKGVQNKPIQKVYDIDVRSMMRDAKAKPFEVFPGDVIEVRQTIF